MTLTATSFARAFPHYKNNTAEQRDTLDTLKQQVQPSAGKVRALSIGSACGEVDLPMLDVLCAKDATVELHCVEPNAPLLAALEERSKAYPRLHTAQLFNKPLEEVDLPKAAFDLVLASHSIYYFDDKPAILRKVAESLAPQGRLVMTVNGHDGMSQVLTFFKTQVTGKTPMPTYLAQHAEEDLRLCGYAPKTHTVHSSVDVTDLVGSATVNEVGEGILSLMCDADSRTLPAPMRAATLGYVASLAVQRGDRFYLPHDVELVESSLNAPQETCVGASTALPALSLRLEPVD